MAPSAPPPHILKVRRVLDAVERGRLRFSQGLAKGEVPVPVPVEVIRLHDAHSSLAPVFSARDHVNTQVPNTKGAKKGQGKSPRKTCPLIWGTSASSDAADINMQLPSTKGGREEPGKGPRKSCSLVLGCHDNMQTSSTKGGKGKQGKGPSTAKTPTLSESPDDEDDDDKSVASDGRQDDDNDDAHATDSPDEAEDDVIVNRTQWMVHVKAAIIMKDLDTSAKAKMIADLEPGKRKIWCKLLDEAVSVEAMP